MSKPMSSDDKRLLELLPPGIDIADALWPHKQSGMRIIKHRYIELLAAAQSIQVVDIEVEYWPELNTAMAKATMVKDTVQYISWGEASPSNNKMAYPVAMAEKRAVDRAILKAVSLHGFFYSEAEAMVEAGAVDQVASPPSKTTKITEVADAIAAATGEATLQKWATRLAAAMTVETLQTTGTALAADPDHGVLSKAQLAELHQIFSDTRTQLSSREAA